MRLSKYGKKVVRNLLLILVVLALLVYTVFFTNIFKKGPATPVEPDIVASLEDGFINGLILDQTIVMNLEEEASKEALEDLETYIKSLQFSVVFYDVKESYDEASYKSISKVVKDLGLPLYLIDEKDAVDPKDYKKLGIEAKASISDEVIQFADYSANVLSAQEVKDPLYAARMYLDVINQEKEGFVFNNYNDLKNLQLEVGLIASNLQMNLKDSTTAMNTDSKDDDVSETYGSFETLVSADEFFSNSKTAQIGFSNKPVIKGIRMVAALGSILSDPTNEDVIKSTTVKGAEINVVGTVGSGEMEAYELSTGDYLMTKYTEEIPSVKPFEFSGFETEVKEGYEVLKFKDSGTPMPYIFRDNNELIVTFVGASFVGEHEEVSEGLFANLEINNRAGNMELRIPLEIAKSWGYLVDLSEGMIQIRIKENVTAIDSFYQPLKGRHIVLDAGHGGKDPGSLNPKGGITEAALNLELADHVETRLKALGAEVTIIRNDDTFVSLWDRVNAFNDANGDYFVSIHHNASPNTSVAGVEMYYVNDDDKKLAEGMANDLSAITGRKNRGPYKWRQYVLRSSLGPSVLVEAGFMSEDNEFKDIQDQTQQILSAGVIADNIAKDLARRIQVAN